MTTVDVAVFGPAASECPDCEAPGDRLCHHWCPRYTETPGAPAGSNDEEVPDGR